MSRTVSKRNREMYRKRLQGATVESLMKEYGVSRKTVTSACYRMAKKEGGFYPGKRLSDAQLEELRQAWEGSNQHKRSRRLVKKRELCKQYRMSPDSIRDRLRKYRLRVGLPSPKEKHGPSKRELLAEIQTLRARVAELEETIRYYRGQYDDCQTTE